MAKVRSTYRCAGCGAEGPQWTGRCAGCGAWNTIVEERTAPATAMSALAAPSRALPIADVEVTGVTTVVRSPDHADAAAVLTGSAEADQALRRAVQADHRVNALAYLIAEDERPGRFDLVAPVAMPTHLQHWARSAAAAAYACRTPTRS